MRIGKVKKGENGQVCSANEGWKHTDFDIDFVGELGLRRRFGLGESIWELKRKGRAEESRNVCRLL